MIQQQDTEDLLAHIAELERRVAEMESCRAAAEARAVEATARITELEAQLSLRRTTHNAETHARLNTLLAICAALLVTHDVEAILSLVVTESKNLFPGTSGVLLFLADPEGRRLTLRAASDARGNLLPALTMQAGQDLAGRAFLSPRAMLITGPQLEMAVDELNEDQIRLLHDLIVPWPPTCALLAPLRVESTRLGSLVLYSRVEAHLYMPRDLPFIQALADLAAVAIDETIQREHAAALQRDLAQTRSLHAEAQARLDTAQAQLLQSAKLAAVGELSASVAHEINNPLYAARNSLYLIEQDLPPDAPQRPFLQIAQSELGRIARIITRMRDFYRPTRAELAPTNVNELLKETVELVQTHLRHNAVAAIMALAPDLPPLTAHADQLRQVFLNLILNACDAMPDGGTLRVETQLLPADSQPATILVRIVDTGVGIAPAHKEHLFEPFYTTKAQGTGLGLAISAHIVTQHAGQITFDSAVGVGSTFTISLPLGSDERR